MRVEGSLFSVHDPKNMPGRRTSRRAPAGEKGTTPKSQTLNLEYDPLTPNPETLRQVHAVGGNMFEIELARYCSCALEIAFEREGNNSKG